jgi:pimeloyl-ACP methyl ester carboxylesterase
VVGGAFSDREAPAGLAGRLAGTFTVYSYDRRGRGKSTDTFPYEVEREIEDLEAIISEAGGSSYVYGHSSGAILALLAAAHGSPIAKLVAYEPPYIEDGSRPRQGAGLVSRLEEVLADHHRDAAAELFLSEAIGLDQQSVAAVKAGPQWQRMRSLAHTLPYDVTLTNNQSIPPGVMPKVQVPTLLVAGGASPPWARSTIEALARQIPNAETLVLEGQTHGVSDDAIVPVLTKFFG